MLSKLRKYLSLKNAALILLGVFVWTLLIFFINFREVWEVSKTIEPIYFLAFIMVRILAYSVWNFKWKMVTSRVFKISYFKLFPIFFAGLFMNNLTPGPSIGGEPLKAYYLAKATKKKSSKCLATAVVDSVIHSLVLFGFVLFSFIYMLFYLEFLELSIYLGAFILVLVALASALIYMLRKKTLDSRIDRFFEWLYNLRFLKSLRKEFKQYKDFREYLLDHYETFRNTLKKLLRNKKRLFAITSIGLFIQLIEFFKVYIIFMGLNYQISFLEIIVVVTVSGLVGYFVFLPGGTGAVEISMIALFSAMGVDLGVAAAVTLINRALFYTMTYGGGYIALNYLNYKYK